MYLNSVCEIPCFPLLNKLYLDWEWDGSGEVLYTPKYLHIVCKGLVRNRTVLSDHVSLCSSFSGEACRSEAPDHVHSCTVPHT